MSTWIRERLGGGCGAAFLGVVAFAMTVAPVGCTLDFPLPDGGGSNTGLFLNTDMASDAIAAGRTINGDAFFIYGTRTVQGGIGEVDAILVRQAGGGQAEIHFELGRPVLLRAADGSTVRVTYMEAGALRLNAVAEVTDAVSGATESFALQIDLARTAAEVAAAIEAQTGIEIPLPDVSAASAKALDRGQGFALAILLLAPLIAMNGVLVTVLGQVLNSMWTVVSVAFRAVLLVAFSPFILFTAILGRVVTSLAQRPLFEVFIEVPSRPGR